MKKKFTVEMEIPKGAKVSDVKMFVMRAILSYPGSLDPRDPMSELRKSSVKVTSAYTSRMNVPRGSYKKKAM